METADGISSFESSTAFLKVMARWFGIGGLIGMTCSLALMLGVLIVAPGWMFERYLSALDYLMGVIGSCALGFFFGAGQGLTFFVVRLLNKFTQGLNVSR